MNETVEAAPGIEILPAAAKQIEYLIQKRGTGPAYLRIALKGGGCSGLSYKLDLVAEPDARDYVLEVGSVRVLVDPKSARFLDGLRLDYTTRNLLEGGWQFHNPNAARSCGCGTSFSPR